MSEGKLWWALISQVQVLVSEYEVIGVAVCAGDFVSDWVAAAGVELAHFTIVDLEGDVSLCTGFFGIKNSCHGRWSGTISQSHGLHGTISKWHFFESEGLLVFAVSESSAEVEVVAFYHVLMNSVGISLFKFSEIEEGEIVEHQAVKSWKIFLLVWHPLWGWCLDGALLSGCWGAGVGGSVSKEQLVVWELLWWDESQEQGQRYG